MASLCLITKSIHLRAMLIIYFSRYQMMIYDIWRPAITLRMQLSLVRFQYCVDDFFFILIKSILPPPFNTAKGTNKSKGIFRSYCHFLLVFFIFFRVVYTTFTEDCEKVIDIYFSLCFHLPQYLPTFINCYPL